VIFHSYIPQSRLSKFVDYFWYHEGSDFPFEGARHLPIGATEIVMNLDSDAPRGIGEALISGPFSESFVIPPFRQSRLMGLQFKPGGAFLFFDPPACELHNLHISLEELWGLNAAILRERLLASETVDERFRILEEHLLRFISDSRSLHPSIDFAMRQVRVTPLEYTVSMLVEKAGLSQRRFIQLFSEQVGLTPKLFLRLQRFHLVLRTADGKQDVDWAGVAQDCGYFDQAHFIHDFRSFAGLTPATWLALRNDTSYHSPIFI